MLLTGGPRFTTRYRGTLLLLVFSIRPRLINNRYPNICYYSIHVTILLLVSGIGRGLLVADVQRPIAILTWYEAIIPTLTHSWLQH